MERTLIKKIVYPATGRSRCDVFFGSIARTSIRVDYFLKISILFIEISSVK